MKYVFLVYQDEAIVAVLDECRRRAVASEALAYREQLRADGQLLTASTLQPPAAAMTVRVRHGRAGTAAGADPGTNGQVTAVWLIEARDLNEAIRLAARMPEASLGDIVVRPMEQEENAR